MLSRFSYLGLTLALIMVTFVGWAQYPAQYGLGLKDVQFEARLLMPISTEASKRGDRFPAQILSPPNFRGGIIEGQITKVSKAKGRKKAEILFQFEKLNIRGRSFPVRADLRDVANSKGVKNVDEEGQVIGKSSHKKQLAGAAVGAGIGALIGGLMNGSKGAAAGAGIGAAAGFVIAVSFTTSGSQIDFAPGSIFTLVVSDSTR